MAGFKITLLVLAALGMAQGHTLTKRATFNPLEFFTSGNQTASALATVTTSAQEIKTTVDAATDKLTSYINIARAAQATAKAAAEAQINAMVDNATAVAATQNGAQACLTKKVGEVKALGAQTLLDVVNCLGKKITQLENMLQTVVTTGNTALTMVPVAVLEINTCRTNGGFLEVFCHMSATMSFVGKVNSVVANVTGVVASATSMVATIQADLTACATLEVGKMAVKAAGLVAGFAVCSITSALG